MRARVLLFSLLLSVPAFAGNAIVPALGAPSSLVITSLEPGEASLLVTFYGPGRARSFEILTLAAGETVVRGNAGAGMIRVSGEGRFTARYGDVPAIPVDALPAEELLRGGNAVIANPWTIPASVTLTLYDAQGEELERLHRLVPALDVLRVETAAASVRVTSQVSVYASDGTSVPATRLADAVPPPCSEPAFLGTPKPGRDEWLVVTRDGLTAMTLTPPRIAALRCEMAVALLEPL